MVRVTVVGTAFVVIKPDSKGFESEAENGVLKSVGGIAKKASLLLGASVVGFGVKAIAEFASFEGKMNEVFTLLPGISGQAMDQMTGQVKDFSKEFGVLPDKVVPALYQALSAGVPQDNVFAFLETAQKAAKGGVTDLTTAVDGISSVINAYGTDVVSATQASDLMFTTVRLGKTNFAELSASLFNVTPTAAALGVKFGDVTAALAAMTLQGVPTSVATTQLRQLFVELSKAGTDTAKTFEKLSGKSFKEFIAGGGNVQGALQLLEGEAKKSGLGINDLFGSVEAGAAALALTGKGTDAFSNALKGMEGSAGATDAAFATMNRGIGPLIDKVKAFGAVLLIDAGNAIAGLASKIGGVVVPLFDAIRGGFENASASIGSSVGGVEAFFLRFGQAVRKLVDFLPTVVAGFQLFVGFVRDNAAPVLAALGVVLVAVLVPAVSALAASVLALFSPVVLIVGAIALLAAGIVYAYQNFDGFRSVVDAVVSFLTGTVLPAIGAFAGFVAEQFGNLVGFVREHWAGIQEAISHVVVVVQAIIETFVAVVQAVWQAWGDELLNVVQIVWNQIQTVIDTVVGVISQVISAGLALINGEWGAAWDAIMGILDTAGRFIVDTISNAMGLLREVVEGGVSAVVGLVGDMPGQILGALGDFASLLYNSGINLMRGFANGIRDGLGNVLDAVGSVLKKARDFLPFSDAKRGPFSDLTLSGRRMSETFAKGIRSSSAIADALDAHLSLSNLSTAGALGGGFSAGGTTFAGPMVGALHVTVAAGSNGPAIGSAIVDALSDPAAVEKMRIALARASDANRRRTA